MKEETRQLLKELAERYETHNFIVDDPVMFPSRYHKQVDVEIVGFIASWLAYGNRKAIIKTCETLFQGNARICSFSIRFHYGQVLC